MQFQAALHAFHQFLNAIGFVCRMTVYDQEDFTSSSTHEVSDKCHKCLRIQLPTIRRRPKFSPRIHRTDDIDTLTLPRSRHHRSFSLQSVSAAQWRIGLKPGLVQKEYPRSDALGAPFELGIRFLPPLLNCLRVPLIRPAQ